MKIMRINMNLLVLTLALFLGACGHSQPYRTHTMPVPVPSFATVVFYNCALPIFFNYEKKTHYTPSDFAFNPYPYTYTVSHLTPGEYTFSFGIIIFDDESDPIMLESGQVYYITTVQTSTSVILQGIMPPTYSIVFSTEEEFAEKAHNRMRIWMTKGFTVKAQPSTDAYSRHSGFQEEEEKEEESMQYEFLADDSDFIYLLGE